MRRKPALLAAVAVLLALLGLLLVWHHRHRGKGEVPAGRAAASARVARPRAARHRGPADTRPAGASGRVVDERGAPVARALVTMALRDLSGGERALPGRAPEPITAVTDAAGRWRTGGLAAGRYTVSAAAAGFVPATLDPVLLAPAQQRSGVELVLRHGGHALRGQVSDIGGGPVAGALVQVTSLSGGSLFDLFRAPYAAMTGDDGRYAIWLADGRYAVTATQPEYVRQTEQTTIDRADRTLDFTLTPGAVIDGQVRRAGSDEPVPGAIVTHSAIGGLSGGGGGAGGLFNMGLLGGSSSVADQDGHFVLRGLTSGSVELRASGPGVASTQPTEVDLGIGEQVSGVVVYVDAAYSISGFVVDKRDHDHGIGGVLVAAYNFSGDVHMAHESTAGDGYFRIDGMHNGNYIVGAAGEDRVVAMMGQSVTVADADVTDVQVELDAGATLSGRVEPPSAAHIGLDMDTSTIGLGNFTQAISAAVASCLAQDDGTFSLKGVPDGSFSLVAEAADGSRARIPVKVSGGADQSGLVLRMKPRGSIAGVVVDPHGQPVEGVRVEARSSAEGDGLFDAMAQVRGGGGALTGKDGRFAVVGLADGKQRVSVKDGKGILAWADPAHQKDDATNPIEVTIAGARPVTGLRLVVEARDQVIRGLVVGPDGQPVADAWVTARMHDDPYLAKMMRKRGDKGDSGGDKGDSGGDKGDSGGDKGDSGGDADSERRMRRWRPAEDPVLTGEDGRFAIRGLRDDTYDLEAEGLKGEARGSIDQVAAGRSNVLVRLKTLASATGHVTQAGKPVKDYLIRAEGPMARSTHVIDAQGSYQLTRLDPGVYTLSVVAPQGRGTATVRVSESHVARKDLDLVAYGAVHGQLVDARTGKPMAGMPVAAFAEGSDLGSQAMAMLSGSGPRTDKGGRFRIERLGSGDGTVMAIDGDKGGFEVVARRSFTLAPGQDLDVGTLEGQSLNLVPRDQRGDLGMETEAATWAHRPRPGGAGAGADDDPPAGVDPKATLLWVTSVADGGPAAAAGVQVGDRVVSVSGVDVSVVGGDVAQSMLEPTHVRAGQPLALVIDRDGTTSAVSVTPRPAGGGESGQGSGD